MPFAGTAHDTYACSKPDAGSTGEAMHPFARLAMHDNAGTKESDSGKDALNDATGGVGNFGVGNSSIRKQNHDCRGKSDQSERADADRLAVQIAVEPNGACGQRRDAQAQDDFSQIDVHDNETRFLSQLLGTRPIR